jgi:filamentous hemagglutinin family protein
MKWPNRFAPLVSIVAMLAIALPSKAQLVPDTTLGSEQSVVLSGVEVRGDDAELIEGGATREANLFHSFTDFGVLEGQRVYFADPAGIDSILTRVTGQNLSNIFGTLGVDGAADLWVINPNGIVFGENALLDVSGSFYGTTAAAVEIGDGLFSAVSLEQSQLLSVSPTVSFWNYLTAGSGDVVSRAQLAAGGELVLSGQNLDLQGQVAAVGDVSLLATDTVQIRDRTVVPFVGYAGGELLVQGNQQVDIVALSHPESGLFAGGDMVLRSAEAVGGDAHYWSGGDFRVETLSGDAGRLWSPVDPIIRSFGDVEISEYRGASLHILAGGSVNIGTATINAPETGALGIDYLQDSVALADGTIVKVDGGAQPTLDVRAGMAPEAIGAPPIENITGFNSGSDLLLEFVTSEVPTRSDITVGDVLINAPNGLVLLTNRYDPNLSLAGGDILVTGEGIYGNGIDTRGIQGLREQGGSVFADSRGDISVVNSFISTSGGGEVGDIVMTSEESVRFESQDGSFTGMESTLSPETEGVGGNIQISANSISLINGAQLKANTFGNGDAGNVILQAQDKVVLDGINSDSQFFSAATSIVGENARGSGGDVEINANSVEVTNGAQLSASTLGNGNAGNVIVNAQERVVFDGINSDSQFFSAATGIASIVGENARGSGGDVEVNANSVEVTNGAALASATSGNGDAGNVVIHAQDRVVFDGFSSANSQIGSRGMGTGGSVEISANSVEITNGAILSSSALGNGNAGNVVIRANSVEATNDALLASDTVLSGNAGNVVIEAEDSIIFDNSGAISTSTPGASGAGGSILISAGAVNLINRSQLLSATFGDGVAGNIEINANSVKAINGVELSSSTFGDGRAGDVIIHAQDSIFFDENSIVTSTPNFETLNSEALGSGGNIQINANSVEFANGSRLISATQTRGDAGNIEISANSVEVINGAVFSSNTFGDGDAGDVVINAQGRVVFDSINTDGQISSSAITGVGLRATGHGGNVVINASSVEVINGANLNASTFSDGDAGSIIINAQDQVVFDGTSADGRIVSSASSASGVAGVIGDGGSIRINANSVEVVNGARLITSTLSNGNAGNILIDAQDRVVFDGASSNGRFVSAASTTVESGGMGSGGNVEISGNSVEVTNGAVLTASTLGQNNAGDIVIDARDRVLLDGITVDGFTSSIASTAESGATGSGGKIDIKTNSLEITNGAGITVNTVGEGNAGDVVIDVAEFVNIAGFASRSLRQGYPSGIFARNVNIEEIGTGAGGDVSIITPRLSIQDGGVVDARTANNQLGGDITIIVDSLDLLQGGQILTTSDSSGSAGTIDINAADQVQISGVDPNFSQRVASFPSVGNDFQPESSISVRSRASGSAGNIFINAPSVSLDEQGQIIAESATVDGGNIDLNLDSRLVLRNGSQITATAGTAQGAGNGGNITINSPFIVAIPTEDSDITANAFQGSGGQVSITAEGVFGIEPRDQRTLLSDITASSELGVNGVVAFNTLDTGFISSNLTELSENLVNTEALVANSCIARSDTDGTLALSGSEGLPQQPSSPQATYNLGSVRSMATPEPSTLSVVEPQAIYSLADGRLVMSRDCL